MTATAAEPAVRIAPIKQRRKDGSLVDIPASAMIFGIPGGPPGEPGIVLIRPIAGVPRGEQFTDEIGGQVYIRGWDVETHFRQSPNFPDGLEIGVVKQFTDVGIGQPFAEKSELQVGPDAYERIRCYAYNEPWLSMSERRKIAYETQQFVNEQSAGVSREETMTPKQALAAVAEDRLGLDEKIAAAVAKAVAAERAKWLAENAKK